MKRYESIIRVHKVLNPCTAWLKELFKARVATESNSPARTIVNYPAVLTKYSAKMNARRADNSQTRRTRLFFRLPLKIKYQILPAISSPDGL